MIFHWINNVDLTPIRRGHVPRVGTEYRLVNENNESLGFVQRGEGYWLTLDPWLKRVGSTFTDLAAARQSLINHNYQGRADR